LPTLAELFLHPSPLFNTASLRAFVGQPLGLQFSVAAGSCTVLVAGLVLVAWQLDLDALKSMLSDAETMKPNAAACLALLGAALVLSSSCWSRSSQLVRIALARTGATIALAICGLTLIEHLGAPPFGIDLWMFRDRLLAAATQYPGRMAPATAFDIALLSVAILLLDSRGTIRRRVSQWLVVGAMLVPTVVTLGYLYDAPTLYHFRPFASMAAHTAALLTLLAVGALFARPQRTVVAELASPHYGGLMARRLLPFVILLPIVLGWVRLMGQRAGYYDTEVGLALLTAAHIFLFSTLIWLAARQLNRIDADRRSADYHAVQVLREADVRWRALVEASAQIVWTTDASGVPVDDSPSWRAFTGLTLEQWRGAGRLDAIHPEDRERVVAGLKLALAARTPVECEYRLRHVSGEWRWTSMRAVPFKGIEGSNNTWVGMNVDITERKRAQSLAEGQKHVLEMIARDAPLADTLDALVRLIDAKAKNMLCSILLLDADGKHLRHGAAPHLPADYTHAIDGTAIGPCVGSCGTAAFARTAVYVENIATDPLWEKFKHLALPHGLRACWSTPILNAGGRVLGTFAIYYDRPALPSEDHIRLIDLATHTAAICLTRHHVMQALRDSERRFRQLAESLPQLVWTCDSDGSCDYLSRQWLQFTGAPAAENLGFGWLDQVHPEDRERALAAWRKAVDGGSDFRAELRIRRHDGVYHWFDTSALRLLDDEGRIVKWCASGTDVTDRKRAEESQLRSQKLEALGTLSGGIAHDFNNMLLVIAGNTQLAEMVVDGDHPVQPHLREIAQASTRASDLVRRILAFSRPQTAKHKYIRLEPVIEEALKLVRATLPAMIRIRIEVAPNLPPVAADATQIHQILVNLATNAAHAIGERRGLIEARLDGFGADADAIARMPDLQPGPYVRLTVSDDGCGMSPEILSRIFDPFFTTKPMGQGTGLGLSIIHGIMQSCGGVVTVQSEPGKGATFALYFPAQAGAETDASTATHPALRGGGQHILLIDDEDALVRLGTLMLTRRGYRVTGCTDPVAAIREFRRAPQQFDVVVTDLSMPGMSGFDCARELLDTRPDIPIVLTSGYIRPEDEVHAKRIGIRAVLGKPGALERLGETLAEVFEPRPALTA